MPVPRPGPGSRNGEPITELTVAIIAAPHGLRGELKAACTTDFPEDLSRLSEVIIEGESRCVRKLLQIRSQKSQLLLRLEGVDTIDAAEALRGAAVKIPRSQAHVLPPGHYYVADIVGMEVLTEAGRSLGVVRDVRRTGSNDVYYTDHALVPAIHDAVVEMDVPGRRMVVREMLVVEDE